MGWGRGECGGGVGECGEGRGVWGGGGGEYGVGEWGSVERGKGVWGGGGGECGEGESGRGGTKTSAFAFVLLCFVQLANQNLKVTAPNLPMLDDFISYFDL